MAKQETSKIRKTYHPPRFVQYGQLQELTAGGTGFQTEKGVGKGKGLGDKQRP